MTEMCMVHFVSQRLRIGSTVLWILRAFSRSENYRFLSMKQAKDLFGTLALLFGSWEHTSWVSNRHDPTFEVEDVQRLLRVFSYNQQYRFCRKPRNRQRNLNVFCWMRDIILLKCGWSMTFVEYHAYGVVISLLQTEANIPETLIKGDEFNCMLRGSRSHVFFCHFSYSQKKYATCIRRCKIKTMWEFLC